MSQTETAPVIEITETETNVEQSVQYTDDCISHRIFVNHVESFLAKHITSYITDQIFGATKIENSPDEAAGEEQPTVEKINITDPKNYEIVGTLKYPFHEKSEDILYTISEDDENFYEEILKCGVVVFNITQNSGEIGKVHGILKAIKRYLKKIEKIGPKTFENYKQQRIFILLSTVMTWGNSKPLDPSDLTVPFSEVDYKKRRSHPNYKEHLDCEREVILAGRKYIDKFKTYVCCSGIMYGHEEDDLNFLFKLAWNNAPYLPVLNSGENFIPLIHVDDLSRILHRLIENPPNKPQYILAVEQTATTLRKICKTLSRELGNGLYKSVPTEEALLYPTIKQINLERCMVNLKMEPVFVTENLQLEWRSDLNLSENMQKIVEEFRTAWKLEPLKVILHGPPASGKTLLAKKICEHYNTRYISVESMITETLAEIREKIAYERARLAAKADKPEKDEEEVGEEMEEEDEDDFGVDIETLEEQMQDLINGLKVGNGILPDEMVIRLLRTFLSKNICQNQGYILDDYPKNLEQAKELFGMASEPSGEEETAEGDSSDANKILPTHVIALDAPDEFLCDRVMHLHEITVQGTPYHEENMLKRLDIFRSENTEDNTVLNFFNEIEIHPILIDITKDNTQSIDCILSCVSGQFGDPIGFGLTPEEEQELHQLGEENKRLEAERKEIERKQMEEQNAKEYHEKMEQWTETLANLQREEEKILIAQSEPLRTYLIKYIFPVLTKGLIEVVKVRPDDPLDFLAEYLFRENPEGKMFDPSYTKDGETLLESYETVSKI